MRASRRTRSTHRAPQTPASESPVMEVRHMSKRAETAAGRERLPLSATSRRHVAKYLQEKQSSTQEALTRPARPPAQPMKSR